MEHKYLTTLDTANNQKQKQVLSPLARKHAKKKKWLCLLGDASKDVDVLPVLVDDFALFLGVERGIRGKRLALPFGYENS